MWLSLLMSSSAEHVLKELELSACGRCEEEDERREERLRLHRCGFVSPCCVFQDLTLFCLFRPTGVLIGTVKLGFSEGFLVWST